MSATASKPRKSKKAEVAAPVVVETPITGFKGFNKDLICHPDGAKPFQYEVGKTYTHDGEVKACHQGFHFCEHPLDVFGYYPPGTSRYAEVEGSGTPSRDGSDTKVATRTLTIKAEIGISGLVRAAIEYVTTRCKPIDPASPASATGDQGAASATGYQGVASATGTRGAASATGAWGAASATGANSTAMASGYCGKAMGAADCALFLVERDDNHNIVAVWAGIAGRDGIKPMTWYVLTDGKPVEA